MKVCQGDRVLGQLMMMILVMVLVLVFLLVITLWDSSWSTTLSEFLLTTEEGQPILSPTTGWLDYSSPSDAD